jgi:fumarate reductase subunit C
MPIRVGENKVSDSKIIAAHYLVWIVVTVFIFWLAGVI